jgi:hypothetical protein
MKYKVGNVVVINNDRTGGHGYHKGDIVKIESMNYYRYCATLISGKSIARVWCITDGNIKGLYHRKELNSNIKIL